MRQSKWRVVWVSSFRFAAGRQALRIWKPPSPNGGFPFTAIAPPGAQRLILPLPSFGRRLPGRHPHASTVSRAGFRRLLNSAPTVVRLFCRRLVYPATVPPVAHPTASHVNVSLLRYSPPLSRNCP